MNAKDVMLARALGSGGGSGYTLPVASPTRLGGVKPEAATDEMSQPVGVDAAGKLWTELGGGGADGKSAYQYAVEGGYTGTEAEFATKMAEEIPDKLPNPHALIFTGTVTGNYDGSAPLTVEIPSGGEAAAFAADIIIEEDVTQYILSGIDPTTYSFFSIQVDRTSGYTGNLLMNFVRADGWHTNGLIIANHIQDGAFVFVRPIDRIPWAIRMRYSNIESLAASSSSGIWYIGHDAPAIRFSAIDEAAITAGTKIGVRGYRFENF